MIFQLHYLDCDSFVLSFDTQNFFIDLENLEDLFDFSKLDKDHELVSNEKKVIGKFKIETPKKIWIEAFFCLRSNAYFFKCGDKNTNKLKGSSKSQSRKILSLRNIKNV